MKTRTAIADQAWGPAMAALTPQQRTFVQILWECAPISASEAARRAGYTQDPGSSWVQGHRLMHREDVKAAILEYGRSIEAVQAPELQGLLLKIAKSDQHKDQAKVALAMYGRSGFAQVLEKNLNVNINVTHSEQLAWLWQELLAEGKSEDEITALLGSRAMVEIEGSATDVTPVVDNFADEEY